MSEPDLLKAVLDTPQDDAPRLAYAAWCDAQGDKAHGDYIRAAVARGRVDRHGPEADRLFKEEMRALQSRPKNCDWRARFAAVDARYTAKMGLKRSAFVYDDIRGFMGSLSGPLPDLLAVLEEVCAGEPIEQLGIQWDGGTGERETPDDPRRLAALPRLRQIGCIYVPAQPRLIAALGASAFTSNVDRLCVIRPDYDQRQVDAAALVAALVGGLAQGFSGVRRLEIKGVPIRPEDLGKLCAAINSNQWTRLVIEHAGLGEAGAKVLAVAPALANVEELWLRENGIGASGITAMVNSSHLAGVRDLDLGKNVFDVAVMQSLAQRQSMKSLSRLGIEDSVQERVYADWTDWTGANIGGGYETRAMLLMDVAAKYPLPGVAFYTLRHE